MVKLHTPFGSLNASGSIGKAITASTWKGRSYLKVHRTPGGLPTDRQRGARVALSWLGAQWRELSDADAVSWTPLATSHRLPGYNAFAGFNLELLLAGQGPTKNSAFAQTGTPGVFSPNPPLNREKVYGIDVKTTLQPLNASWAVLYFLSPVEAFSPDLSTLFLIVTFTDDERHEIFLRPIPPGAWWIRCQTCTIDGVLGPPTVSSPATSLPS